MRCTCEAVSRGEHGIIADEELLGRIIFSPQHINAKGAIKPGLFNLTDIKTRGLSLVRVNKIESGELKVFAEAVAGMIPNRSLQGYANFLTSVPRNLFDDEGGRRACVFDDPVEADGPIPENPAHALLISAINGISEADAMEIRAHLMENHTFSTIEIN